MRWVRCAVPAAATTAVLAACSFTAGSGTVRTESRDVHGFSSVQLTGSGEAKIQQTGSESLTIEAEENLLPLLTGDVSGGVLTLGTKPGAALTPTRPILYRVTVRDLVGLSVSGSGSASATDVRTAGLGVDVSGSGTVTAVGRADSQQVEISGSGHYRGNQLDSSSAIVRISGSGDAEVNVRDKLDAQVTGSGTLRYTGSPQVSQTVSGSGKVSKQ